MSRRDRTLLAAPFDGRKVRTTGPSVAVLREVAFGCNGAAAMAVSENGTLVYATGYIRGSGMASGRLARVSETGEVEPLPFDPESFGRVPMPSPDGRSLAVMTSDGSVWIYDLARRIRRALPLGKLRAQGYAVILVPERPQHRVFGLFRRKPGLEHLPAGRGRHRRRRRARASRRGGLRARVHARRLFPRLHGIRAPAKAVEEIHKREKRGHRARRRPRRRRERFARRAMARL